MLITYLSITDFVSLGRIKLDWSSLLIDENIWQSIVNDQYSGQSPGNHQTWRQLTIYLIGAKWLPIMVDTKMIKRLAIHPNITLAQLIDIQEQLCKTSVHTDYLTITADQLLSNAQESNDLAFTSHLVISTGNSSLTTNRDLCTVLSTDCVRAVVMWRQNEGIFTTKTYADSTIESLIICGSSLFQSLRHIQLIARKDGYMDQEAVSQYRLTLHTK